MKKTIIEPVFNFLSGESTFLLSQGKATVCIQGKTYSGDVEVSLELLPRADVYLYGVFPHNAPFVSLEEITSFCFNGRSVDGFAVEVKRGFEPAKLYIRWCPKQESINCIGDDSAQMSRVIFHVFNFVEFFGMKRSFETRGDTSNSIEYIELTADNWQFELRSLFETQENFKKLKASGGYCLTHIGCLQKSDATAFSGKEAGERLEALRFFLSFAKGGWCEPVCAVGFDKDNNSVWESWSSPHEPWHEPPSWFDKHNSTQLSSLFSGFMGRWSDSDWREALHEVIYWYLNANYSSRGIDAGIILTQAAIERLSYEFSVKHKRLLTGNGSKDLLASDKFRLLFSSLQIPIALPNETPELQKLAKQRNWIDAPHALTKIRNSLVHPEHKQRGKLYSAYYEAWNLGLWYLEMGILAICGYSGTYGNRLKQRSVGEVEKVPWES